jgi:hypothetical protein
MSKQDQAISELENVASEQDEILEAADVVKRLGAQRQQNDKVRLLFEHAEKRGFTLATGPKDALGFRRTVRAKKLVRDQKSGREVSELAFEMNVQDLEKQGTKDQLAIVTVQLTAGDDVDSYAMLVEVPGGDFEKMNELKVQGKRVVKASSWWSRLRGCLRRWGSQACKEAIVRCSIGAPVSPGGFVACVYATCGPIYSRCAHCATCRCRWWCKWGSGCCR